MCPYGVTYQSADCCFSELALSNYKNPNRRVGLVQCRHHRLIDINFWPWYNWKIAGLALNNNHSLISSIYINYKKGCTRLAAGSDKVYQLLAHGRWFSPGTPASSTCKTGLHDIALKRGVLDTPLWGNVCQWLVAGRWFCLGIPVSATNKTDSDDITEMFLKRCWTP
jgi:hypothetical protein